MIGRRLAKGKPQFVCRIKRSGGSESPDGPDLPGDYFSDGLPAPDGCAGGVAANVTDGFFSSR
jgi:hypothetical protein